MELLSPGCEGTARTPFYLYEEEEDGSGMGRRLVDEAIHVTRGCYVDVASWQGGRAGGDDMVRWNGFVRSIR